MSWLELLLLGCIPILCLLLVVLALVAMLIVSTSPRVHEWVRHAMRRS